MSDNRLKRTVSVVNIPDPKTADTKKNKVGLNAKDEEGDREESGSTANALIVLAVASCELFHDERGEGYVLVHEKSMRCTFKLRSRPFSSWLIGAFYKATKRAPNGEAMRNALAVLEAEALHRSNQREMFNRFAVQDDAIFIDMADKGSRAVKVTASGWEILDKPPVMFRRYSHQKALPEPIGKQESSLIYMSTLQSSRMTTGTCWKPSSSLVRSRTCRVLPSRSTGPRGQARLPPLDASKLLPIPAFSYLWILEITCRPCTGARSPWCTLS